MSRALREAIVSANSYRNQLQKFMAGATDAIAQVAEGIVLDANAAWRELFGLEDGEEVAGTPIMDLFAPESHASLKGALVACMRGRWPGDALRLTGLGQDARPVALEMTLEPSTFDHEPSVRISVAREGGSDGELIDDLNEAVKRDPATGLYGRLHFLDRLAATVAEPPTAGVRAVALIRPDGFGDIVGVVGPVASEQIIMGLASTLRDLVQPNDLYGRLGGTTFAVVLGRGNHRDLKAWAHEYCRRIAAQMFELGDKSMSLTCTVGLCVVQGRTDDIEELLSQALDACNKGRNRGGGRVSMQADDAATTAMHERDRLWIPRIKQALIDNRFRLAHQPIASLAGADPGFADILIRMLDEQGDEVLPGEFMPAAERNKLVKNIDRWVLSATMMLLDKTPVRKAFVKLSRPSVLDETLLPWLDNQFQTRGLDADRLVLQVSESIADQHLKQTRSLAETARAAGYGFALENFGIGARPQQVLKHLPLDFLKIDGSLMQGLAGSTELQERVTEYAATARERQIQTIAERVEDANTMAVLWQAGIEFLQGYQIQEPEVVLAEEPDAASETETPETAE
jgi:diguanylate cyclase (GGDEF)-like protein